MNQYIEIEFLILRDYPQIFNLLEPILHIKIDLVSLEERLYSEEFESGGKITICSSDDINTLVALCCHDEVTLQLEMARVIIRCKNDVIDSVIKILQVGDFKYKVKE